MATRKGDVRELYDDWTKPEAAHAVMSEPWVGYTVFVERNCELSLFQRQRGKAPGRHGVQWEGVADSTGGLIPVAAAAGWGESTGAVDPGSSGPCWMGYWNSYVVGLFSVYMSCVSLACVADIAFCRLFIAKCSFWSRSIGRVDFAVYPSRQGITIVS